jgi:anaerobic magnesium-protoporphyrin IX monomethyl ester cyclase
MLRTLNTKNVRVLLVNPPLPHNRKLKRIYPMGLLYIASYIRKHNDNVSVEIFNPQVTNTGFRETLKTILSKKWDILGFGYWTNQFQFVNRLCVAAKEANPSGMIVHGGVHPTLRPEAALQNSDAVILHEGEKVLGRLIEHLADGDIDPDLPGLARMKDGRLRVQPFPGFITDLDDLPFPAWDLLDLKHYHTPMHVLGGPRFPIIGSRGCPYNCSFCVSPTLWRRRVRWRSPENIVDELEHIIKRFGVDKFHFWDDNLLLNRKHVAALAEEILRRNLRIKWLGLTRASHVVKREDVMPLLARAGLIGLEIGIESANPTAYHLVEKSETLDNLIKACEIQKRNGMFPMYTYMSYLPGDTIRGAYEQAKFMDELLMGLPRYDYFHHLPFDIYIGQCCTPHVGTRMFEEAEILGRLMWEEEEDFHHSSTCFLPHTLLQDKPVKMVPRLSVDDRVFSVIVAYVAIADYLSYDGPLKKVRNVAAFNRLLDRFWAACDGNQTLLHIATKLHREDPSGLDLDDTLRFIAAASITLAQVGALDSADRGNLGSMIRKHVPYKYKQMYRSLLHLSRLYGKLTGITEFRVSKHRSYDT